MNNSQGSATVSKGLKVLACFSTPRRSFTMAEIARHTGFDRATARRLCLSLVEAGYLSLVGRELSLTPKILSIAGGYLGANDIGLSVQPVLDRFAESEGRDIALAVKDGDQALYVVTSRSDASRLSFGLTVGSSLPLPSTAVGRALLAQCPAAEIGAVLARVPLPRHTEQTRCDPAAIEAAVADAAATGYAYVENEFELGAAAIAVPVGTLSGSPAVVGTTQTVNAFGTAVQRERALDALRQTAMTLRRLSLFAQTAPGLSAR
ncbi:MAG: IclR family transcriptional regulator C-terminal domain-containing protein [Pseudomonadota bacterium]